MNKVTTIFIAGVAMGIISKVVPATLRLIERKIEELDKKEDQENER